MAFKEADKGDKGYLSQAEFYGLMGFKQGKYAEQVFHAFDQQGNGRVTLDQFIFGMSALTDTCSQGRKIQCKSKVCCRSLLKSFSSL